MRRGELPVPTSISSNAPAGAAGRLRAGGAASTARALAGALALAGAACGAASDPHAAAPRGDGAAAATGPREAGAAGPGGGADARPLPRDGGAPLAPDAEAPRADGGSAPRWTCRAMEPVMNELRPGFGRVCVEAVTDPETWASITLPGRPGGEIVRVTKFFLPAGDAAGIPPSYFDANRWAAGGGDGGGRGDVLSDPWHLLFAARFLPRIGGPTDAYLGPRRVAWAGILAEIEVQGVGRVFGYDVEDGALPCEVQTRIHAELSRSFALRPLYRWLVITSPTTGGNAASGCDLPVLRLR